MRGFKCCLGCEQRCENCHSNCQAYKKEKIVYSLLQEQKRKKQKADAEYSGYDKQKRKKIEQAAKRKHR